MVCALAARPPSSSVDAHSNPSNRAKVDAENVLIDAAPVTPIGAGGFYRGVRVSRRLEAFMMRRKSWLATAILSALAVHAACSTPAPEQSAAASTVTVFEGARLIVGDGTPPIENATFIVDGTRFTSVGRPEVAVQVPAGAARVDLKGKTVMPALIDTHTHMAQTRDALVNQLQGKAYYGVA